MKGYTVECMGDSLRVEGADSTDECHTSTVLGTINVTDLRAWAQAHLRESMCSMSTDLTIHHTLRADLDEDRLREIMDEFTPEQIAIPDARLCRVAGRCDALPCPNVHQRSRATSRRATSNHGRQAHRPKRKREESALMVRQSQPSSLRKAIERITNTKRTWEVWSDFCELSALSFANAVSVIGDERRRKREERYLQIAKSYEPDDFRALCGCLGMLIDDMEVKIFDDILGRTFMDLDLGSHWHGQFFTPYHLALMMGRMTFDPSSLDGREFIRVQEPACGAGGMVIGFADAMRAAQFNPQTQMHVTAIDIDPLCVHMCYVQLSLLGIPAIVVHGNTLTLEQWDVWYTPAHVVGLWSYKLRAAKNGPRPAPVELPRESTNTQQLIAPNSIDQMTLF